MAADKRRLKTNNFASSYPRLSVFIGG